jgi:hypothetical protein
MKIPTTTIRAHNHHLVDLPVVVVLPVDFPVNRCVLVPTQADRTIVRTLVDLQQQHTRQLVPIIPRFK